MNRVNLINEIKRKKSFLCIGLDPVLSRIPKHLLETEDPIFEFNKMIIDVTSDLCVAYKPNIAFYEALGVKGWQSLQKTLEYIPKNIFTIADAKRGDIGNTSRQYAEAFFEAMSFDSITVAPYMGVDSVSPFLEFENKWVVLLALTSNKGSNDFQRLYVGDEQVYKKILRKSSEWGTANNMMYVVGATHPASFKEIRDIVPDHFLLVPGVGAQGGELKDVVEFGWNDDCGLLVNSSRGIIYAGDDHIDFHKGVRSAAHKLQQSMEEILIDKKFI